MLKWEKRLTAFLEKHMLALALVMVSLLALYLRRGNIWYHTEDFIFYFDAHENHTQSALYYLLVGFMGYLFEIPLHGVKWLAGMADFLAAGLAALLCCGRDSLKKGAFGPEGLRSFLCFALCVFAPAVYLRGCVWAQVDSLAITLLLGGALCVRLWEHRGIWAGVFLAAAAAALYPPCLLLVVWYCLSRKGEEARIYSRLCPAVLGMVLLLSLFSGFALGWTWQESVGSCFRWLTYHPYTGERMVGVGEWLWQQGLLFACSACVLSILGAFAGKLSRWTAAGVNLLAVVCYGIALGWGI